MERPSKRQKLSSTTLRPYPTDHAIHGEELSCTHADAMTEGSDGRPIAPTPTLIQYDLRRRYIFGGSSKKGRDQLLRANAAAKIYPRVPDTTVVATAVAVNVQDGTTTIANTVVLATDATVISFASIGVLTVPAQTTASDSTISSSTTSDSAQTTISSTSSSNTSLPTDSITSSVLPSLSLTPGYNSSAPSTSSDKTTSITVTSTLNVSFSNGTVVTLSNSADTTAHATLTSSTVETAHHTGHTDRSTVTSATPGLSSSMPASATGSVDNGASAGSSSGGTDVAGLGSPTTAVSSATSSSVSSSHGGVAPGPATPEVVGGVVGGVAGLAFLLLIMLALLRWYRKRLQSRGQLPEQIAARTPTPGGPGAGNPMSQSSHTPFAAAFLSSTKRWRPHSSATTATAVTNYSTVPDSERGFQRIAGRKIEPVIGTGTDQYGGNYGAFEKDFAEGRLTRSAPSTSRAPPSRQQERGLAESSFYRDSRGFYGGKGEDQPVSPTVVSSPLGHSRGNTGDIVNTDSTSEDPRGDPLEGYAVMRPSPARTPVTSSPSNSSLRLPIQQGPLMVPGAPPTPALPPHLTGRRPDGVGRSLSSQDGSRGSRFTESV